MTCPVPALPDGHRNRKRSPLKPRRFRSSGLVRQSISWIVGRGAEVALSADQAASRSASHSSLPAKWHSLPADVVPISLPPRWLTASAPCHRAARFGARADGVLAV